MQSKSGPILIGLAYLGIVVFIILFCSRQANDFAGYSQYWGLFGTLVGVATGAIPTFFFKTQADQANDRASRASEKARAYAEALPPEKVNEVKQQNRGVFE